MIAPEKDSDGRDVWIYDVRIDTKRYQWGDRYTKGAAMRAARSTLRELALDIESALEELHPVTRTKRTRVRR